MEIEEGSLFMLSESLKAMCLLITTKVNVM